MKKLALIFSLVFICIAEIVSADFMIKSRYDYYTDDSLAAAIVVASDTGYFDFELVMEGERLFSQKNNKCPESFLFSFPVNVLRVGDNNVQAIIEYNDNKITRNVLFVKRKPSPNAVKIDYWTGGLLCSNGPFFPLGFYCYSPVQKTLPEEERVKGFNLMSPYQKILDSTWEKRRNYLDRAARLGMKVNYQLLSVAENGGVGAALLKNISKEEKKELLKREIERVKNHPALLSWYLCDEPVGQNIPLDSLKDEYDLIKELDPYHPVSMVFMTPSEAKRYESVMDIVMADPYPIPNKTVTEVSMVAADLENDFRYEKPYWIVPQAFGGNETWMREPTGAEIRSMFYLAMVYGCSGSQAFIRHGLNAFPKSMTAWEKYGQCVREIRELSPFLLKGKRDDSVFVQNSAVYFRTWSCDDQIMIMAVNSQNRFHRINYRNEKKLPAIGKVKVAFENRWIELENSILEDIIGPFGRKVYIFDKKNACKFSNGNLFVNPGFEKYFSPGVPSGCYASIKDDRGAHYYLDPINFHSGAHSLKLVTPKDNNGCGLGFFPIAKEDSSAYFFKIFVKGVPYIKTSSHNLLVSIGGSSDTLVLQNKWNSFEKLFTWKDLISVEKLSLGLNLATSGEAWVDDVYIGKIPDMNCFYSKKDRCFLVETRSELDACDLYYSLDNEDKQLIKRDTFEVEGTNEITCFGFYKNKLIGRTSDSLFSHLGLNGKIHYDVKLEKKELSLLMDGLKGTLNYADGRWLGMEKENLEFMVELENEKDVKEITMSFLRNQNNWIFLPRRLELEGSYDGDSYEVLYEKDVVHDENESLEKIDFTCRKSRKLKFIRVKIENSGVCPSWHKGKGKPSWFFCDELIIR